MNSRDKIVDLIKDKTGLDYSHSKDLEIGIYNWTIKYAENHRIVKNWNNSKFNMLYLEKARSTVSNIDKNSYIENKRLLNRLQEKEFFPHDIPFMRAENIFPEMWIDTVDNYKKRYEHAYENKIVAMTDMYTCGKCKKKRQYILRFNHAALMNLLQSISDASIVLMDGK